MTNPQYSRKEGSQYSKERNTHDTLKVEEGNTEDFSPVSFLTKSFENGTLLMFFIKCNFSFFFFYFFLRLNLNFLNKSLAAFRFRFFRDLII